MTSSSADLLVRGDDLEYNNLVVGFKHLAEYGHGSDGHSNSFSSVFDYQNFDLGSSVSSLRIGKTSNSQCGDA